MTVPTSPTPLAQTTYTDDTLRPAPTKLAPCVACDIPRYPGGAGARPGHRSAAPRGACSTCYSKHRKAGTLDQLDGSVYEAATYVPARERSGTFGKFQLRASHLVTDKAPEPATALPDVVDPMAALAGYVPATALPDVSQDDARRASLAVCARSTGPAQARTLLAVLGLVHA